MKTFIKFSLAFVISVIGFSTTYAEIAATTTRQVSSSTQGIVVTQNGDELCVLSNGNSVPCEFKSEAEYRIEKSGAVYITKYGEEYCPTKDRTFLVPCRYVDLSNGEINQSSRVLKQDIIYYIGIVNLKILSLTSYTNIVTFIFILFSLYLIIRKIRNK